VGLGLAVSLAQDIGSGSVSFAGVQPALVLAFFLPLVHWRDPAHASPLDRAVPFRGVAHDLLRVACGAAWTCATVVLLIGLFDVLALFGLGRGYPAWYPLPALTTALILYLLGSAVWLRAGHPGRILFAAFLVLLLYSWRVLLVLVGVEGTMTLGSALRALAWSPGEGSFLGREWLRGTTLLLGGAAAAVLLSATADAWTGWPAASRGGTAWRALRLRIVRRSLAAPRGWARRAASGGTRRPAAGGVAFRRELALVGHRMAWPLAFALLFGWGWLLEGMGSLEVVTEGPTGEPNRFSVLGFAFLVPMLVWLDERGLRPDYEEALPVDAVVRRVLRVAAGAVWLAGVGAVLLAGELAGEQAGTPAAMREAIPPRVWIGVLGATLLVYLLGSLPALLASRHPLRWCFSWWLAFNLLGGAGAWPFSPWAALAPLGMSRQPWEPALALWLPLAAAATVAAAVLGTRLERAGRRSFSARPAPA
jgi:hypothetical protein